MSDVQKVSVALTAEQVSALKAAVATGGYATTSEVVREAIREWQFKRDLQADEIKHLRELWAEGKASGKPQPFDIDRVISKARARSKSAAAE